jgi:Transposase DDE domain
MNPSRFSSRSRGPSRFRSRCLALAEMSLCELAALLAPRLSLDAPYPAPFRERLFTPVRIFWLFLAQVFSPATSCRESVRKALAWLALAEAEERAGDAASPGASPSTSAFCQARLRIKEAWLTDISQHLTENLESNTPRAWCWRGHPVKVVDGSSVSMADTPANQERWPQPEGQKQGCGFPVARIVGVFSLATGVLLSLVNSSLHVNERRLFRGLFDSVFRPGDVVLADRGFCGFAVYCELLRRGVHSVMRRHQRLQDGVGLRKIRRLGRNDVLLDWVRSPVPSKGYDRAAWKALPERMQVRQLTVHVEIPGFRTETIQLLTTLLDRAAYPADSFAGLYRRRWAIELRLRDLKTPLGMEVIRCKSPAMVEKTLLLFQIAHNLVRSLMIEAAETHGVDLARISFKGTLASARQWAGVMTAAGDGALAHFHSRFLESIARDLVPDRPGRREPRAYKRRRKNYARLVEPRRTYHEILHRNRYTRSMRGDE